MGLHLVADEIGCKRCQALHRFRGTHMTVIWLEAPSKAGRSRAEPRRGRDRGQRMLARLRQWRWRARDRAELAALDDRTLTDIGISRAEAEFLSRKPFWRE